MEKNIFARLIASALNLQERAVANTLALLEEGCTIPFISRYRKERTGGLDEVQIAAISDRFDKLQEIPLRQIAGDSETQGYHHQDHHRSGEDDARTQKAHR